MKAMPSQKPGRSKQDYQTPPEFLAAVRYRLGIKHFSIDLAASVQNTAATRFYSEADNSLVQPWTSDGWAWLNPPFGRIEPWVQRAWEQSQLGAHVAMLVPAGVGSNWWARFVHQKAFVLLLNRRLTFVGHATCYPKDCALLLYGPDVGPGYVMWKWSKSVRESAA